MDLKTHEEQRGRHVPGSSELSTEVPFALRVQVMRGALGARVQVNLCEPVNRLCDATGVYEFLIRMGSEHCQRCRLHSEMVAARMRAY